MVLQPAELSTQSLLRGHGKATAARCTALDLDVLLRVAGAGAEYGTDDALTFARWGRRDCVASLCCAPRCRPRAHRARASHCSARRREAARTNGCVLKGPVGCGSSSSSTVMYVSTRASIATTATLARAIQIGHDHKDLSSVERAMLGGERGGGYRHLIFLSVVCGEEDPSHHSGHSFPKPSKHFGAAAKSQDRTAAAAVRHFGANSHPQLLVPWRVACGGGELAFGN